MEGETTDLISLLTQQLENAKLFAKNHKMDRIQSLFDALPDEIVYAILSNLVGREMEDALNICLVCKRFDRIIVDILYSKRYEFNESNDADHLNKLEKVDHWMEKIMGFGFFNTYRKLSIGIVNIINCCKCLYMYNDYVVFCFYIKDDTHNYILSNDMYYCRVTHPYVICSDASLNMVVEYTDYNLNKYNVIEHNDVQIYSSKHSSLTITEGSGILICQGKVFAASNEYFNEIAFDEQKFWVPDYNVPDQEIFNIICGAASPLPMMLLQYSTSKLIENL